MVDRAALSLLSQGRGVGRCREFFKRGKGLRNNFFASTVAFISGVCQLSLPLPPSPCTPFYMSSQVRQFSLSETWMVLGPDLVSWKLTEARVWAMLRDEEALQASKCALFLAVGVCQK